MGSYYRPTRCRDALDALAGDRAARPMVGGTDLLVGVRHRTSIPSLIVDLKAVGDLPDPLELTETAVRIGPTLTMGRAAADPTLRRWFPALVEAVLTVGSVAIRNRASLIGNVCNASPAADTVGALLVHDATVTISAPSGERRVPLDEFLLGPRRTRCGAGEIVTQIELPKPARGTASAFQRLTRRRGVDLATVNVAACLAGESRVLLGVGAVGPRVLRTELRIDPATLADPRALVATLDSALDVATPISDIRGSRDYRAATVRVLARRAVLAAAERRAKFLETS